ncbi:MAG: hypothetical protein WB952_01910 [Terriglobales bacterium]
MKVPRCLPALVLTLSLCGGFGLFAHAEDPVPPALPQNGPQGSSAGPASTEITIAGPLRPFLRMAGISQQVTPEEVMPLLARNVFTQGYEGWQGGGSRTEYLVLLMRYVKQAKELAALAGPGGVLHVSNCDEAAPLLHLLGYRTRQGCGQRTTSVVTADPERAFLTIDSGFPLSELEETLQGGKPFSYPYLASRVPLQFTERDWMAVSKEGSGDTGGVLDALMRDPVLSRLYWALTETDTETRQALLQAVGLNNLLPFAATLDFYGSQLRIRAGRVMVPGGQSAEPAWKELVGASPESPAEFIPRLLGKDKGWLVAYFDALSRVNRTQQAHFTESRRLRRCYEALRGQDLSPDAARTAFRPAPGLLLLLTRLQWEPGGEPHVPGNLEVWKETLRQKTDSKVIRDWGKRAGHWSHPEQLLDALFGISRVETDLGPLQAYLTLSELDSRRPPDRRLSPQTVHALAAKFAQFSDQYLVFSEFPELDDASITLFVNVADTIDKISNHPLRGNAMGVFQANTGLWQIMARQGQIPTAQLNSSWQGIVKSFAKISSPDQVFDAGRDSLAELLRASTGKPSASEDEVLDLLAGPPQGTPEGKRMHQELVDRMRSVLDSQRLVSLDTLLSLGSGLNEMASGKELGDTLIPLAGELREFEMPRPIFTSSERTQWAAGIYNNRHTEMEMRTDLTKVIKSPASRARLEEARGQLSPLLRDTLVGLNYAYYEPPGAQMLHHNPLFVRSHDFSGETVIGIEHVWQAPQLFGEGSPAGGGAHLVGSLADLPYVLAEAEQDFIAPAHVQALIWKELVPGLLVSATVPRWWSVSRNELHAVALYQRTGEELLAAAVGNKELQSKVVDILSERVEPQRLERVEQGIREGHVEQATVRLMPADTFYLATEFRRKFPQEAASCGPAGQELESLSHQYPDEVSWERLSRDFGVPHPILAQTYARELLNIEPFPAFEGYSSRLLAESWDSNNLYWARLADEMGYSPVLLNRLAPELTRRMVEKIFATNFEDWPAILRAMRETGEELRQGKIALLPTSETMARQ